MKAEAIHTSNSESKTACGKCSCITVYTSEFCVFCDAAEEILMEALTNFGVSKTAFREVDVETEPECGCRTDDVTMLPTIKVCDQHILGLPEEQSMKDAVMQAVMKDCFCE
ncbi:MAG: glutaredoxin family protein [Candidatus Thorarchaeota archaeon]|jgi:glutaredoxin